MSDLVLSETESLPVVALLDTWLDDIEARDDTREAYARSVDRFITWMTERGEPVSPALIRDWRDSLAGSPATINLYLSSLRSFFAWAVKAGYISSNPAADVQGRKRKGTTIRHKRDELTAKEIQEVMSTCDDSLIGVRDRAMMSLMAYAGVRAVETHRADVADLDTRQGRRILWVQGKGHDDKDDFVVIQPIAEADLQHWLAMHPRPDGSLFVSLSNRTFGQRLSRAAIREIVKRHYKQAGILGLDKTTHSLRHSAISAAIRGGATPTQAKAMARHANINTTLIYYHERGRLTEPAEDLISYD